MKTKTLVTILSLLCILCAMLALGTSAEENTLSIQYGNVAYNEMTQLAFTLKGTAPDGKSAGIAVWNSDVADEKTVNNASYFSFTAKELDGVTYYLTNGIPASEMSVQITVAPCLKDADGNVTIAGALINYSVYDYVRDRLDDDNLTAVQVKLYTRLVYYGNCAEKLLGDKTVNVPLIIAKGGEAGAYGHEMTFADDKGGAVIRANTRDEDGNFFLYWTSKDGTKIYERVAYVTAGEGNCVYTANYGAASESAYAGSPNLNDYSVGALNLVPSSASIQASGDVYYVTGETSHLNSLLTVKGYTKVLGADDKTVLLGDTLSVKEENGEKYISFEKNFIKSGLTGARVVINNPGTKVEERIDLDIRINSTGWLGMDFHLYFTNGTTNKEKHPSATFDSSGNLAIGGVAAGNFKVGDVFNLSLEICEDGVKFYVDGSYVTTISTGNGAEYNNAASFRGFGITGNSGCDFDIDILSVNFVDTDLYN